MGGPTRDGELWSFEQRLRRTARRHSTECTDPSLIRLLHHIGERRSARAKRMDGLRGLPDGAAQLPPSATRSGTENHTPGTVIDAQHSGPRVRIIRLARPRRFEFRAGQYVKLGLPGSDRRNDYSIASAPHEPYLELCIEHIEGGRLSPQLATLQVGDRVTLPDRAKGSFVLDDKSDLHIMVATTTGIAPLRSMLLDGLRRTGGRFVVLHGASHADELPYREELEQLAGENPDRVRYTATVSRAAEARNRNWRGRTGRVDALAAELLAGGLPPTATTRAYACGNSGMIRAVQADFAKAGIPVTTEAFD